MIPVSLRQMAETGKALFHILRIKYHVDRAVRQAEPLQRI
jgi:hypothetical protein